MTILLPGHHSDYNRFTCFFNSSIMNFLSMIITVFTGVIFAIVDGGNETNAVRVFQNGTDQEFPRVNLFNRIDEGNRQGKHYDEITPCYDNHEKHFPRQRPCGYGPIQSVPVHQPTKYVYQYPIYQYPVYKYPTMAPLPVFKPVPYIFPTFAPLKSLPIPQYKPLILPSLKPLSVKSITFPEFKPLVFPALKPFPTFAPMKSLPLPTFKPFVFPSLKPLPVKSFQFLPWVNPTFAPLKTSAPLAPLKSLPIATWPSLPTTGHKTSGINFALVKPNEHISLSLPHKTGSSQIDNVGNTHNSINITIAVVKNCSKSFKDVKCHLPAIKDFSKQPKDKTFAEIIPLLLGENKSVDSKFSNEELNDIIEFLLNKKGKGDGKGLDEIIGVLLDKKGKVDDKGLDKIIAFLLNKEGFKTETLDKPNVIPSLLELKALRQLPDNSDIKPFEFEPTKIEGTFSKISNPSSELNLTESDSAQFQLRP